ncbi:hypothetical protein ACTGYU_12245, partial [Streptococcus suis]
RPNFCRSFILRYCVTYKARSGRSARDQRLLVGNPNYGLIEGCYMWPWLRYRPSGASFGSKAQGHHVGRAASADCL